MKLFIPITLILTVFIACNFNNSREEDTVRLKAYISKGDSIVKSTFDTLRYTLAKTIGENGLAGALQLCNVQAASLTSLFATNDIVVSRVSNKNRNPENKLSALDIVQWEKYEAMLTNKDAMKSVVVSNNNKIHYYKPIIMQAMCLSCHGALEKEIPKELLTVIDSLYPSDKAKGYKVGDLRGMWRIDFKKEVK